MQLQNHQLMQKAHIPVNFQRDIRENTIKLATFNILKKNPVKYGLHGRYDYGNMSDHWGHFPHLHVSMVHIPLLS